MKDGGIVVGLKKTRTIVAWLRQDCSMSIHVSFSHSILLSCPFDAVTHAQTFADPLESSSSTLHVQLRMVGLGSFVFLVHPSMFYPVRPWFDVFAVL